MYFKDIIKKIHRKIQSVSCYTPGEQTKARAKIRWIYIPLRPTPFQQTLSRKKALRYKLEQQLFLACNTSCSAACRLCETPDTWITISEMFELFFSGWWASQIPVNLFWVQTLCHCTWLVRHLTPLLGCLGEATSHCSARKGIAFVNCSPNDCIPRTEVNVSLLTITSSGSFGQGVLVSALASLAEKNWLVFLSITSIMGDQDHKHQITLKLSSTISTLYLCLVCFWSVTQRLLG